MTISDSLILSDSINFKTKQLVHPKYQYTKQYPQESIGNYPLQAVQGPTTTFQLIPNVMNLSKCKLAGTILIPAQGDGNFTWMNVNGVKFIQRINVQPQGGGLMMDVNFIDRYSDCTARRCQKYADVLTWDAAVTYAAPATIPGASGTFFEGLIPGNFATGAGVRLDGTAVAKTEESEYVTCSTAANTALYFDFTIELDKYLNSILSLDKDLYWRGDILTKPV